VSGRLLLLASAAVLLSSGAFAIANGLSGRFLPHDEAILGMTARKLCALQGCRIVHFMIHDRISFGGALIGVGLLYVWLIESPLRRVEAWAWRALAFSGAVGFASFFAYLSYGYLDSWHGFATLGLFPCFVLGMVRSRRGIVSREVSTANYAPCWIAVGLGHALLLATAAGMICGGLTIMAVGMTCVFVPQDLKFIGLRVEELHALNPRLVPLIAHDRAGFGGAVCCCGIALFYCLRFGKRSRGWWWVLFLVGVVGFGAAVGVHPAVGYNDLVHLAPALVGAATYFVGLALLLVPALRESK
jgi:hypothetical protein